MDVQKTARPRRRSIFGANPKMDGKAEPVPAVPTVVGQSATASAPSNELRGQGSKSSRSTHRRSSSTLLQSMGNGKTPTLSRSKSGDQNAIQNASSASSGESDRLRSPSRPPQDARHPPSSYSVRVTSATPSPSGRSRSATVGSTNTDSPVKGSSSPTQLSRSPSTISNREQGNCRGASSSRWHRWRSNTDDADAQRLERIEDRQGHPLADVSVDATATTGSRARRAKTGVLSAFGVASATSPPGTSPTTGRRGSSSASQLDHTHQNKGTFDRSPNSQAARTTDTRDRSTDTGFLRRIGSRTKILGGVQAANASQESLVSLGTASVSSVGSTTSAAVRQIGSAASDAMPDWTAKGKASSRDKGPTPGLLSTTAKPQSQDNRLYTQPQQDESGVQRRFSGWLAGMMGGETPSNADLQNTPASSGRKAVISARRTSSPSVKSISSNNRPPSNASSSSIAAPSQPAAAKGRYSGGLLATFSASARARATAAANSALSSSGFDRALQYIHGGESGGDVWLLGVKHSVGSPRQSFSQQDSGSHSSRTSQSLDLHNADPAKIDRQSQKTATAPVVLRSPRGDSQHEKDDDSKSDLPSRGEPGPYGLPMKATAVNSTPQQKATSRVNDATSQSDFELDFQSRIWCTYRSHFPPIARDGSITTDAEQTAYLAAVNREPTSAPPHMAPSPFPTTPQNNKVSSPLATPASGIRAPFDKQKHTSETSTASEASQNSSPSLGAALGVNKSNATTTTPISLSEKMGIPNFWGRATAAVQATGLAGRSGLTTDSGWGCMLRTGQSLLANALIEVHLGREWRKVPAPASERNAPATEGEKALWLEHRACHAQYHRVLSWFMDDASLACPFGVHRMAREGKRLGKEVGEWFGPSTAAGAIRTLVDAFPESGIGVSVATDGVIYQSDVKRVATLGPPQQENGATWQRPVLILIGVRLGLEGVNPMYYDSIQQLFAFPQSVGIAGGRPSSSYYFVGYQGDSLYYLDPHHVRPAIPFKHPPPRVTQSSTSQEESDEWWAHAYTDTESSTFHCDRPKRMPMRSMDPSMLLAFLVKDEASLDDLTSRVKSMPKAIFSIQQHMPRWMREDGDEAGLVEDGQDGFYDSDLDDPSLESFSESSLPDGANASSQMHQKGRHTGEDSEDDVDDDDVTQIHGLRRSGRLSSADVSKAVSQIASPSSSVQAGYTTSNNLNGNADDSSWSIQPPTVSTRPQIERNDTVVPSSLPVISAPSAAPSKIAFPTEDERSFDTVSSGWDPVRNGGDSQETTATETAAVSGAVDINRRNRRDASDGPSSLQSLVDVPAQPFSTSWEEVEYDRRPDDKSKSTQASLQAFDSSMREPARRSQEDDDASASPTDKRSPRPPASGEDEDWSTVG